MGPITAKHITAGLAAGATLAKEVKGSVTKTLDIIDQSVTDKDEAERIKAHVLMTKEAFDIQNTIDAREREENGVNKTGRRDYPLYALAGVVVLGYFLLMVGIMKFTIPEGNAEVAYILFGGLNFAFGCVVQYFFGSSQGSNQKNQMLAGLNGKK